MSFYDFSGYATRDGHPKTEAPKPIPPVIDEMDKAPTPDMRASRLAALEALAAQAQELKMGY